jgi:hypothetical protein
VNIETYLDQLAKGEIPEYGPDCCYVSAHFDNPTYDEIDERYAARRRMNHEIGFWPVISLDWAEKLAEWIDGRSVLEVMAGTGYLALALSRCGVDIVATDSYKWNVTRNLPHAFPVRRMRAQNAVRHPKLGQRDILLCSWPHYEVVAWHVTICPTWGEERPIVYIGEGPEGCTATNKFFEHFRRVKEIRIPQWPNIHDYLWIGHWSNEELDWYASE